MDKGQVFTLDTFIAIGLFIIVLITIAWSWDITTERIKLNDERTDMEVIAKYAIASLLETPGMPSDWHDNDDAWFASKSIGSLGLSSTKPSILNRGKVERLQQLNSTYYQEIKKYLGIRKYDFCLSIYTHDGTSFPKTPAYSIGIDSSDNEQAVIVNRYASLNNQWTKATLKVWK